MGEHEGERARSAVHTGLSLARQPAIWIGCSGVLGSAGFAALRVAETMACAALSVGHALGVSRWGSPVQGLFAPVLNPATGRWLVQEAARERPASLSADDLEYFCSEQRVRWHLRESSFPCCLRVLQLAICWLWNTVACAVESMCARLPPTCSPAEGGGWREAGQLCHRECVFGDATHTLRDEAKDEGGLVASAGHLPCRRQCWRGGTSRKRVRSGGSEAEGNCFFLLHTVTVTPDTLQDAGGSKFTC